MTKKLMMTEAQELILERLIEAMETDIALPMRVGPRSFGSSMPETVESKAEIFARRREDITETGGQRNRQEDLAQNRRNERLRKCSRERITRMEEAFEWIRQYVWDAEARQVLLAYAEVKARGWDWSKYIMNRNRKNPQKSAWIKRTLYRWIVKTLQGIEAKLRQSETIWLPPVDGQVAHRAA